MKPPMDIEKTIRELHEELKRIDEAILTLERLQEGSPRRGRPPRWLDAAESAAGEAADKPKRKRAGRAHRP
jgi:hypothetical protein